MSDAPGTSDPVENPDFDPGDDPNVIEPFPDPSGRPNPEREPEPEPDVD